MSPRNRLLGFVACFIAMYAFVQTGDGFQRWFIEGLTVPAAVQLINAFGTLEQPAVASGSRIVAPGGGLNVLQGCEGLDVLGLWLAATTVGALSWPGRLLAWTLGSLLVFGLNQLRLVSLFSLYRTRRDWFADAHGLWWPLALVVAVLLLFLLWQQLFSSRHATPQTS